MHFQPLQAKIANLKKSQPLQAATGKEKSSCKREFSIAFYLPAGNWAVRSFFDRLTS